MKHYWILTGAMAFTFLLLFGIVEAFDVPLLSDPSPWMGERQALAAAVGVGLLVVDVLLPVPSSLVMIAHGALFGIAAGGALSLGGALLAGWFAFGLGRYGGGWLDRLVPPEERVRGDALLYEWGAVAVVVSRPVPILAETIAILAGTSPMSWGRMTAATLAGAIPAAVIYAAAGAAAASFDSTVLIFALVLAVAGLFWMVGKWLRRAQDRVS